MDEELEQKDVNKFAQRDKKKQAKMHVSGKSVFNLKKIIESKNDSSPKRKNTKKNR